MLIDQRRKREIGKTRAVKPLAKTDNLEVMVHKRLVSIDLNLCLDLSNSAKAVTATKNWQNTDKSKLAIAS